VKHLLLSHEDSHGPNTWKGEAFYPRDCPGVVKIL